MADNFITGLQSDWTHQAVDVNSIRRTLRRSRWTPHILLCVEVLAWLIVCAAGTGFVLTALRTKDMIVAISGLTLVVSAPAFIVATVLARLDSLRWGQETPQGVLRHALRRIDASAQMLRIHRWNIYGVLSLDALLWIGVLVGAIEPTRFLWGVSGMWIAACALTWVWVQWRARRLSSERAQCQKLLSEYERSE